MTCTSIVVSKVHMHSKPNGEKNSIEVFVAIDGNDTDRNVKGRNLANKENNLLFVKCFVDVVTVGVKVCTCARFLFIRNEYIYQFTICTKVV